MTKYISDVQTVEESGTTGIRITVSEDIGETSIRAVNTLEFDNINTAIQTLQEKGITVDNLDAQVRKLVNLNASTLENHPASYFATATDLNQYAKASDLEKYRLLTDDIWIGRITKSGTDWNYTNVEGVRSNFIRFSTDQGFCIMIRPGGYTETTTSIPVQLVGFSNGQVSQYSYSSRDCSVQTITWVDTDGSKITEDCLICPISMTWTNSENGYITCNYHGRSVTRLWEID